MLPPGCPETPLRRGSQVTDSRCLKISDLDAHNELFMEHSPELDRRSADRCHVFPVSLGIEAIHLDRRGSMKSMLCAAIAAARQIDGRS
jgi:hypothetical protein